MDVHAFIGICTPIPAEESGIKGVMRLGRITPEWHWGRNLLIPPMGYNVAEIYADGMEVGVARTKACRKAVEMGMKYLFFLDWDTIPPQDTLCKLVYHLENNPDYDIAAGMYWSKTKPPWPLLWREWEQGASWDWTLGEVLKERVVGVPMGCTLLRVSLFQRLPPLDPWFETINDTVTIDDTTIPFRSTEDLKFCQKYGDELKGKILMDTGIQCVHIEPTTGVKYQIPENCLPMNRAKSLTKYAGFKRVLHVGCGPKESGVLPAELFPSEEWLETRLDINPAVKPDIIGSMTDMRKVDSDSMDAVFSNHNLEHLYAHEVALALQEFRRVLRPGGIVHIHVPDIQRVAEEIAKGNFDEPVYESPAGPVSPVDMLYGYRPLILNGNHFQQHKIGFTESYLQKQLFAAGFSPVSITHDVWNLNAQAIKPQP